ncbi:hypothetical protein QTO34_016301, partial [Cnephaeus nilssonii]
MCGTCPWGTGESVVWWHLNPVDQKTIKSGCQSSFQLENATPLPHAALSSADSSQQQPINTAHSFNQTPQAPCLLAVPLLHHSHTLTAPAPLISADSEEQLGPVPAVGASGSCYPITPQEQGEVEKPSWAIRAGSLFSYPLMAPSDRAHRVSCRNSLCRLGSPSLSSAHELPFPDLEPPTPLISVIVFSPKLSLPTTEGAAFTRSAPGGGEARLQAANNNLHNHTCGLGVPHSRRQVEYVYPVIYWPEQPSEPISEISGLPAPSIVITTESPFHSCQKDYHHGQASKFESLGLWCITRDPQLPSHRSLAAPALSICPLV